MWSSDIERLFLIPYTSDVVSLKTWCLLCRNAADTDSRCSTKRALFRAFGQLDVIYAFFPLYNDSTLGRVAEAGSISAQCLQHKTTLRSAPGLRM